MTITSIALDKLAVSPENVRKTRSKSGFDELKASILAHVLLNNLVVTQADKGTGGVVLTAKAEETHNWIRHAKACGRETDLIRDQLCRPAAEEAVGAREIVEEIERYCISGGMYDGVPTFNGFESITATRIITAYGQACARGALELAIDAVGATSGAARLIRVLIEKEG